MIRLAKSAPETAIVERDGDSVHITVMFDEIPHTPIRTDQGAGLGDGDASPVTSPSKTGKAMSYSSEPEPASPPATPPITR
jgi:hypothetical protein